ncbi:MAG: invertase recombinase-like protein [Deltaproteobacteria bacterium HGW-Deltaproteobacteria-14]|nr:MAG: invertase recombinase-like protein [Deltaproteobacteria bacterium HGW-Deltaproteobacteria-14]
MIAIEFGIAAWLLLGACGDDPQPANDTAGADSAADTTGVDASDTASPTDTLSADGVTPDVEALDTVAADAVADAAVEDTTALVDTRDGAADAVEDAEDAQLADTADTAGPSDVDTGDASVGDTSGGDTSVGDTSVSDTSVGDTSADDAVIPQADNVIAEGSFEQWSAGLPVGWFGGASNLASDSVVEDTSAAHDGVRACQLINAGSTHKRFTTAPFALAAGHYSCTYWVRGAGEIRNARYAGDYSSYSSYTTIDADTWTPVSYAFNAAADVATFELIFSVRNTGATRGHLHLDDVRCARTDEPCDAVTCQPYQVCQNATASCVTAPGFCDGAGECASWQVCGADHRCALAPGACVSTADCDGDTPVCDLGAHACVAGDPCAGVQCSEWQQCRPSDASCQVAPGRCAALVDCDGALPTCDLATHTCIAVDAPANVVPNGGFEAWGEYTLFGATSYLLPDYWYGVCDGCSPYYPTTEIAPANVRQYTAAVHGGSYACQLVDATAPAERFVTEPFAVVPGRTYHCAYRVRGHGTYRQRAYCGGWGPDTTFTAIDSDDWQRTSFTMSGAVSWCVLVFYASNTNADRDHIQLDDVVCIAPTP